MSLHLFVSDIAFGVIYYIKVQGTMSSSYGNWDDGESQVVVLQ